MREVPAGVRKWSADYSPGLERMLRTNRLLLSNDPIAAMLALKEAYTLCGGTKSTFLESLQADVATRLQKLTGEEFLLLAADWPGTLVVAGSYARLEGRIMRAFGQRSEHKNILGADAREYFAPNCTIGVGESVSFNISSRRNVIFPGETIIVTDERMKDAGDVDTHPK